MGIKLILLILSPDYKDEKISTRPPAKRNPDNPSILQIPVQTFLN
jgi:hypothetical protein